MPYRPLLVEVLRYNRLSDRDITNRKLCSDLCGIMLCVLCDLQYALLCIDRKSVRLADGCNVIAIRNNFKLSTFQAVSLGRIIGITQLIHLFDQKLHRDLHWLICYFKLCRILSGIVFLNNSLRYYCSSQIILCCLGLYHIERLLIRTIHVLCHFDHICITILIRHECTNGLGIILTLQCRIRFSLIGVKLILSTCQRVIRIALNKCRI